MNRLKLAIAGVLAAALAVTSLPLQAFAQAPPNIKPFRTVSVLKVKNPDTEPIDLTNSLYTEAFTKPENWTNYDKSIVEVFRNSFKKALDGGNWAFVQAKYPDKEEYRVRIFWTEKPLAGLQLKHHNGLYNLCSTNSDRFYSLNVYWYQNRPTVSTGSLNSSTYSCIPLSGHWSGLDYSTFLSNFEYTKSKELDGVDVLIPKTINDPRQPEFAWNINEKGELFVTYMKNDQKLNSYLNYCKARWVIDEVGADYKTVIREGVFNDLVPIPIHSYQLENRGFYSLKITIECNIHPPLLPYDHSYIRPLTFNIPFDGNYHRGSTFLHCDSDNNCNPEPIDCNQLTGVSRVACTVNGQFNFGVLNPSLFAMRSLVSSFFVPTVPTCGIGFSVVGNKVVDSFSPSKAVAEACRLSARFQQKFPLLIIITNFVVASAVLWLIIRAVNNLLDHRKDEVVGGM